MARPPAVPAAGAGGGVDRARPELSRGPVPAADRGEGPVTPSPSKFPSLSVFFPAYNDAPSLPGLVNKTFDVLERHAADYEVIVVNDGSQDKTAEVLEQLRRAHAPRMRVVTH